MVQPALLGNATRRSARTPPKSEKRKNQTARLQPAANKKREQSKARHHENRRRRKSIAKNRRRQVSKCTRGGVEQKKIIFFSRKTIEFGAMAMDTNKHTQELATKNTQAKEDTEDEKHKACMGLRLS